MGIIGVVAALTLPNLNSSTGDKEKVAKVKKIYSNLEDAMGRAQAVYGPDSEWQEPLSGDYNERWAERITEFIKISKDCGSNCLGCFNKNVKDLSGRNSSFPDSQDRCYILVDGTSIGFQAGDTIYFDIDGLNKGSNTWGKDVFQFYVGPSRILEPTPDGLEPDYTLCFEFGNCSRWIIDNGNMDYLKANKDGKCNNNTSMVLDGVSNVSCK